MAKALASRGLSAVISNSRGPASLAALIAELSPSIVAVTAQEAAEADIVVLAVRWGDVPGVLRGLPDWNGRIVVDATNPLEGVDPDSSEGRDPNNPLGTYGLKAVDIGDRLSSEIISEMVPGARLVKAFNHFEVELLVEPEVNGGQRVLFYSGNDDAAKQEVGALIEQLGMFPVDLGRLNVGGALATMPFGALASTHFIKI